MMDIYKQLTVSISFVLLALLSTSIASAAIKFDFMDEPWALNEAQKQRVLDEIEKVDLNEIKSGAEKIKDQLPDGVIEGGEKLLEESGIDAGGVFFTIFNVFKEIALWFLGLFSKIGD